MKLDPIPAGRWAIGVSGGADSVALLALLRHRADLSLHIAHLDHETRNGESAIDAAFVAELARKWNLPATIASRSKIEPLLANLPHNQSSRFRAVRFAFFAGVIESNHLAGVILAHHQDDQAETIVQRLLRGSGIAGLAGMSADTHIGTVRVLRPMLSIRRSMLRAYLLHADIAWREDSSNAMPISQRNRIRQWLDGRPDCATSAIALANAAGEYLDWLRSASPTLSESFFAHEIESLPEVIARESARRWLADRAGADVEISPASAARLVEMACDAATPARQQFAGGITVTRRKGRMSAVTGGARSADLKSAV